MEAGFLAAETAVDLGVPESAVSLPRTLGIYGDYIDLRLCSEPLR